VAGLGAGTESLSMSTWIRGPAPSQIAACSAKQAPTELSGIVNNNNYPSSSAADILQHTQPSRSTLQLDKYSMNHRAKFVAKPYHRFVSKSKMRNFRGDSQDSQAVERGVFNVFLLASPPPLYYLNPPKQFILSDVSGGTPPAGWRC
jgi:hypothetical protein